MKVLAVTVNYRTPELTVRAFQSELADVKNLGGRIMIVDNDSRDGSFNYISDEVASSGWGENVKVVKAPKNGGFGYGVNFALTNALNGGEKPEYLFLLGPDASIDRGSLIRLVAFMDANPHVGLAGSKTFNADNSPRISAFRFPGLLSELENGLRLGICSRVLAPWTVRHPIPRITTVVDWVSAACVLVRTKVFKQVGMFDESFFLYYEEVDLCRRLKLAGWPTYFVTESTATHLGQVSTGINDLGRRRPDYWFDSRRHYFIKHHGITYLWCSNLVFILSRSIWRIRRKLRGDPRTGPPHFLRDFVRLSFSPIRACCSPATESQEFVDKHESNTIESSVIK